MSNYYLPTGSPVCQQCSTANCAVCPNNVCTICLTNYFLSGAACSGPIGSPLANCLYHATATTCLTCNDGYYLGSDSKCYLCQQNCLKCTGRFTCTTCSAGYYLSSGACVRITDNCYEFDSSLKQCTLCNHGYYLF